MGSNTFLRSQIVILPQFSFLILENSRIDCTQIGVVHPYILLMNCSGNLFIFWGKQYNFHQNFQNTIPFLFCFKSSSKVIYWGCVPSNMELLIDLSHITLLVYRKVHYRNSPLLKNFKHSLQPMRMSLWSFFLLIPFAYLYDSIC